jgi:AcrR family transcriptional regulator
MTVKEKLIESITPILLKYGVRSVSMDDMAKMLGISKKTIYSHIENKKGLIQTVISSYIKKEQKEVNKIRKKASNAIEEMTLIARLNIDSLRTMSPMVVYELKKYHPSTWKYIETIHFEFIKTTIQNNLIRGKKENLYREDVDENIITQLYFGLSMVCIDEDVFDSETTPLSTRFLSMIIYHLNGVTNEKGKKELKKQIKNIVS